MILDTWFSPWIKMMREFEGGLGFDSFLKKMFCVRKNCVKLTILP